MAVVSSLDPNHQSSIVGATVASRFVPTLRLDASQPPPELVRELNAFQPESLVGYASILRLLAEEQQAGRLAIRPHAVMSASEVLTDETRESVRSAFGVAPTNVYGATETAGIASQCRFGRLLQPLIRYEMSDRAQALDGACPDGLPYPLIGGVQGREEEVLTLSGVIVHPNVFHRALERIDVAGWQVIDEGGKLSVLLERPAPGVNPAMVGRAVAAVLEEVGVRGVEITAEAVDAIPRTILGKAPLVRRATPDSRAAGAV